MIVRFFKIFVFLIKAEKNGCTKVLVFFYFIIIITAINYYSLTYRHQKTLKLNLKKRDLSDDFSF